MSFENISWLKIIVISSFVFLFIIILVYILSIFFKIPEQIKKRFSAKHLYLLLFIFPIFYLIYFNFIYNEADPNSYIISGPKSLDYLEKVSLILIGSGIFSATSKYINNLVIFKEHFEDVIMSEKFEKLITNKLASVPFSDEHLSQLENIHKVWEKITLFKYEQKFPELMNKLRKNLKNGLIDENELNSYYKNFKLQINIKLLENDIVQINEISSSTLIPKSEEDIPVDFWVSTNTKDKNNIYAKFISEKTKVNGKKFEDSINGKLELKESNDGENHVKHYKFNLKGSSEYHLEREVEMTQYLIKDRLYGFTISKVVDDISVHIQCCDKLDVFFTSVDEKEFREDNHILPGISYINRDVILPGDVFYLFIFKK